MKKIYSLLAAVVFTSVSFAQSPAPGTLSFPDRAVTKTRTFDRSALKAKKNSLAAAKTTTAPSGWFNYGLAAESLFSATSDLNSNYLFPDSLGYGEFGAGTFAPCWIHHLAEVNDFRSIVYSPDNATNWVTSSTVFSIDSMSIFYAYTRNHPNPNIVDTLVITMFDNTSAANVATGGFLNSSGYPGGADTLSFKRLGYRQALNVIGNAAATANPVGQYKFKVLLNLSDTAAVSYREKAFAVPSPFISMGSKLVIADVQFIPGYTYTLTQQIDATANTFFFTSLEENGAGTFFTFQDCNFGSAACDYNSSQIIPIDVRYNQAGAPTAGGWNGRYIPAMAYTAPYAFEHHLISFKLTGPTGIQNNVAQNTFGLTQNMPNPYTKEAVVNYSLPSDVNSAVFTVTDIMGRVVSSEKVGATAGSHSVKLGSYAAGVYYYSLNVDGNVTTKKMIVE